MQITQIKAQVKTKGRYSIYIDNKYAFGLSELGLINSGIRVGLDLTPEQLAEYKDESQIDRMYNLALNLLARRPRSKWEIEEYFRRKQIEKDVTAELISRLDQKGYINDTDFARRWVESRRLLKPISRRKLQVELKAKRVSDSVIAEVLAADDTQEYEVLVQEVQKKRKQSRYADDTKLLQYLARQGYGYEDIKRALTNDATG